MACRPARSMISSRREHDRHRTQDRLRAFERPRDIGHEKKIVASRAPS